MKLIHKFILISFCFSIFIIQYANAQESTYTNLPEGAKLRIGKGTLGEIAYFPDGTRFAVATSIGIWVYDSITGKELYQLTDYSNGVYSIRFSPDGNTIATESPDGRILLWGTNTGNHIYTLSDDVFGLYDPVFSPNGKIIAVQSAEKFTYLRKTLRLYDVKTGKHLITLNEPTNQFYKFRFSPDSKTLVMWLYGKIKIWNVFTTQQIKNIIDPSENYHHNKIIDIQFSPDGGKLFLLNSARLNRNSIRGSRDGDVGNIFYKDVGTEEWTELASTLQSVNDKGISKITFSPDGNILTTTHPSDNSVDLWNANTADYIISLIGNDISKTSTVCISENNKIIATGGRDGTINLWTTKQGMHLKSFTGHRGKINKIAISPDGITLLSKGSDKTVRLWDILSGKLIHTLEGYSNDVVTVSFSPDGKTIASGSSDNKIRLWNVFSGQLMNTLSGHSDDLYSVCFSPKGEIIASAGRDKTVRLWNTKTGEHLKSLTGHHEPINRLYFISNGQIIASGNWNGKIHLWDSSTGQMLKFLYGDLVSPDGKILLSIDHGSVEGEDSIVYLSHLDTGQHFNEITYSGSLSTQSFSPDGKTFATVDSNNSIVEIWDVQLGEIMNSFSGHLSHPYCGGGTISTVRYAADGKTIASGSQDKTIRLWNTETGKHLKTLTGHTDGINSLEFSPDGTTLASGSSDGTILMWDISE